MSTSERDELRRDRALRRRAISASTPDYRWTNEDYTPIDHAPFVGWSSSIGDAYLVATGFNAWGITNGTAAAMLIADLIEGRDNPWLKLFDATRIKPVAGADGVRHGQCRDRGAPDRRLSGAQAARASTRSRRARRRSSRSTASNVAAYRDEDGRLHAVLGGLHPYGLPGRLERDRPDLGLPLPRLALRARRRA